MYWQVFYFLKLKRMWVEHIEGVHEEKQQKFHLKPQKKIFLFKSACDWPTVL